MIRIPVLKESVKGNIGEMVANCKEFIPLQIEGNLIAKKDIFAIRVNKLAISEVSIFSGDLVVIDPFSKVKNGDIVLARVEGKNVLKFWFKKGNHIELRPQGKKDKPIKEGDSLLEILGKVIKKISVEDFE